MDKMARKTSEDPDQDRLREMKTVWNIKVTKFIATLIAVKRAINGQAVPVLNIDKSSIKEPLPEKASELLHYLSSQFEEATSDGLRIVDEQREYSEGKINKNASNILSRLLHYTTTPFDFSKTDRWKKQKLLRSSAKLYDLISNIEEDILTRKNNSIPEAIFNSKLFIHNFINDLAKPLYKIYEDENSHLLSIIKDINIKMVSLEAYIKSVVVDETNIELIESLKSLVYRYKSLVHSYKLTEAIDTYTEIEEMLGMFSKSASKAWVLKKYLKIFNKEDSSIRIAASEKASNISKSLDQFMNAIQSGDDLVSLASILHTSIENIFEFVELLDKLADVHNNIMNLQKNEAGKPGAMLVPSRDITFLRNIRRELGDSLLKFKNISGS